MTLSWGVCSRLTWTECSRLVRAVGRSQRWRWACTDDNSATVWRVTRAQRRGVATNEEPLTIPITATLAQLANALEAAGYPVGGRFHLVPCDPTGATVGAKVAEWRLVGTNGSDVAAI